MNAADALANTLTAEQSGDRAAWTAALVAMFEAIAEPPTAHTLVAAGWPPWENLMNDELLKTCIHEYGHSEVARALGVHSFVDIWPNESGAPDEKSWRGKTNFQSEPTGDTRVLICLAGVVAETLLADEDRYTLEDAEREAATIRAAFPTSRLSRTTGFTMLCRGVADSIADSAFAGELSDSDLAGMSGYSQQHVRKTVRLVLANEAAIREAATLHSKMLASAARPDAHTLTAAIGTSRRWLDTTMPSGHSQQTQ